MDIIFLIYKTIPQTQKLLFSNVCSLSDNDMAVIFEQQSTFIYRTELIYI